MVSIGEIIYRLLADSTLQNVKKSDMVIHIKYVIDQIGAPALYEDKRVLLDIYDYRAQIPNDFVSRTAVRRVLDNGQMVTLTHNTDDFATKYKEEVDYDSETKIDLIYTHKIVGDFIYVDFLEGKIELLYKAFVTDENGWPMIEADVSLLTAIEWYVRYKHYHGLWVRGLVPDKVFQHTEQQYRFYIGQASTAAVSLDPIEAEALGNSLVRLLQHSESVESNFKYNSQKERLRTYWRR